MLSLCPFVISAGVGAFVIGLSQIVSFFSCRMDRVTGRTFVPTVLWYFSCEAEHRQLITYYKLFELFLVDFFYKC